MTNTMVTKVTIVQLNFKQSEGVLSHESGGKITASRFVAGQFFCGSSVAASHGKYDAYGNQ